MPRLRPAPPRPAAPPHADRNHHRDGPHRPGPSPSGQSPTEARHTPRAQAHNPPPRSFSKTPANTTGTPNGQDVDKPRRSARTPAFPQAATAPKPLATPRSRLGHRPDLIPGFERALTHARAYAAEHGHLAAPRDTHHNGFRLGWWLFSQRNRAKQRARDRLPPSPHLQHLAAIDPWWNPPWDLHWQRNYHRARKHVETGQPFDPAALIPSPGTALGSWITRACLNYHHLHPGQQQLLAGLGITAEAAHARTRRAYPWRTAVEHARTFAETHGHLAVPRDTTHNGFPLGQWLNKQRYRTRRTGPTPAAHALTSIDPWWNPPRGMVWQHAYQRARTNPHTPASRRWIQKQRRGWLLLHPLQQHLLTHIGLAPPT
ncbi:helicase associated domain-containing protein [Streptomyces africanus]|uniref:helicase associated domain-containing protein n=1 Tax=Streptomyces africanus TaxID=231024 RepID=UPI001FCA017C|nr:helicase associated domain-containing protein [Streptomyces africanus]